MISESQKSHFIEYLESRNIKAIKDFFSSLLEEDKKQLATTKLRELSFLTPLSFAAIKDYREVVETLLDIQEVKDNADAEENQALWCAADRGNLEIVKTLLQVKAVKKNAAIGQNLAAFCATENGHHEILEALLAVKAVRNTAASEDNKLLRVATENGDHKAVKILLKNNAVKNNAAIRRNEILYLAVIHGHHKIAKILLKIDVVRNNAAIGQNELLRLASMNGDDKMVEILLTVEPVKNYADAINNEALRLVLDNRAPFTQVFGRIINGNHALEIDHAFHEVNIYGAAEIVDFLINDWEIVNKAVNNKVAFSDVPGKAKTTRILLTIEAVQRCLLTNGCEQLLSLIDQFPVINDVIDTFTIYGMPLAKLMTMVPQEKKQAALKSYINHPLKYLEKNGFSEAVIAAVNIYYTAQCLSDLEREFEDDIYRTKDFPLSNIIPFMIAEHFENALKNLNKEEQKALFDALVMLSSENAKKIITDQVTFPDEAIQRRETFIHSLKEHFLTAHSLIAHIKDIIEYLTSRNAKMIYVNALLADIGGPWNIANLRDVYKKCRVDNHALMNPWAWDETPHLEEQIDRLRMQIEVLLQETCLGKNAMQVATQIATLLLEQKNDEAVKMISKKITNEDERLSVLKGIYRFKEIVNELPEIKHQKAALCDQLIHRLLKAKASLGNEDIKNLERIVDSVVDDNTPLKEAAASHFSKETIWQLIREDEPILINFQKKKKRDENPNNLDMTPKRKGSRWCAIS